MNRFLENSDKLAPGSTSVFYTPSGIAKSAFFYLHGGGDSLVARPLKLSQKQDCDNGYLVLFSAAGRGVLHYRQQSLTVEPSSALFIDCSEPWQINTVPNEDWRFVWVHFDGQSCRGYFHQYTRRRHYNLTSLGEDSLLAPTILRLIEMHQNPDSTLEFIASQLLNNLLTEMIVKNELDDPILNVIPNYIHDAAFIIENEYDQQISLSQVALRVGVSTYYLSRQFKSHIGKTFTDYLGWFRVEKAKKYLRESELSVEQICYQCGMRTVSHFINIFRMREGMTPLVYRKHWLDQTSYPSLSA